MQRCLLVEQEGQRPRLADDELVLVVVPQHGHHIAARLDVTLQLYLDALGGRCIERRYRRDSTDLHRCARRERVEPHRRQVLFLQRRPCQTAVLAELPALATRLGIVPVAVDAPLGVARADIGQRQRLACPQPGDMDARGRLHDAAACLGVGRPHDIPFVLVVGHGSVGVAPLAEGRVGRAAGLVVVVQAGGGAIGYISVRSGHSHHLAHRREDAAVAVQGFVVDVMLRVGTRSAEQGGGRCAIGHNVPRVVAVNGRIGCGGGLEGETQSGLYALLRAVRFRCCHILIDNC